VEQEEVEDEAIVIVFHPLLLLLAYSFSVQPGVKTDLIVRCGTQNYIQWWDKEAKALVNRCKFGSSQAISLFSDRIILFCPGLYDGADLGEGTFGLVVGVLDTKAGNAPYALKVCRKEDKLSVDSFNDEVRISDELRRLDPTNIG
jgi:hypothetical protein